jgi:putative ABC transport system substrate-binding protein
MSSTTSRPHAMPATASPSLVRRAACGALLLAAAAGGLPAFAQAPASKSVAVTAIVEHPALDAIRDGVREALRQAGYETGKNLKWDYQSAQGNTGTAAQIARKFVGDKPDAIVAIATPSAQAVVAATKTIPVVYSGVTDPVAAQLVKDWKPSGTNVTGVSDLLVLDKQIALIRQLVPGAKRIGMVYNPGEANSAVVVKQMRELLSAAGLTLVEAAAPRSVDVGAAARTLIGKVDAIYTNTDNNVVSAYEALVKVGNDAKIPLVAADTDSVKRGAVAALGIDYRDLGLQTGRQVVRILKGEAPGAIASETSDKLELVLNAGAAKKQGVTLPPELRKTAKTVIE